MPCLPPLPPLPACCVVAVKGVLAWYAGHDSCALRQVCETGVEGNALCRPTRSSVTVQVEEETCSDDEVDHPNPEAVAWFAIEGRQAGGMISATPTRLVQGAQPVIGETAPLQVSSEWQLIELINWYEDPVVLFGPPTSSESDEAVVRVRGLSHGRHGCAGWCFETKLQEPRCGDEAADVSHRTEGVSYFVVEKGQYLTVRHKRFMVISIGNCSKLLKNLRIVTGRGGFVDGRGCSNIGSCQHRRLHRRDIPTELSADGYHACDFQPSCDKQRRKFREKSPETRV